MTIALIPKGIVIAKIIHSNGSFDKSTFMYKSDRPIAFNRFIFIADNGVSILARHKICISGTQGNHLSVNNTITNGLANMASKIIIGKVINEL